MPKQNRSSTYILYECGLYVCMFVCTPRSFVSPKKSSVPKQIGIYLHSIWEGSISMYVYVCIYVCICICMCMCMCLCMYAGITLHIFKGRVCNNVEREVPDSQWQHASTRRHARRHTLTHTHTHKAREPRSRNRPKFCMHRRETNLNTRMMSVGCWAYVILLSRS